MNLSLEGNHTLLKVYYGLEGLSLRASDAMNVSLLPLICLLGTAANMVSLACLLPRLATRDVIHFYMTVNSAAKALYLLIQFFIVVVRCGALCSLGYTFDSKAYDMYVCIFFGYTILLFVALNDIGLSLDRVRSFQVTGGAATSMSPEVRRRFVVRLLVMYAFSFLFVLPNNVLSKEIVPIGVWVSAAAAVAINSTSGDWQRQGTTLYGIRTAPDWDQPHWKTILTVNSLSRRVGLFAALIVLNGLILKRLKSHMAEKRKLTEDKSGEHSRRVTLMVVALCSLYLAGNLLDMVGSILNKFVPSSAEMALYDAVASVFLYASQGLSIFIYYNFDRSFRARFQTIFSTKSSRVAPSSARPTHLTRTTFK